ncbi:MAG: hypothetical protein E2P02_26405 [Acidobacteria bacterium]|nr:MAG: hypothetical protein E2P02_26405 [Acidobacteriota bacterium]
MGDQLRGGEIWVYALGSGTRLTVATGMIPAWSPDGLSVAYAGGNINHLVFMAATSRKAVTSSTSRLALSEPSSRAHSIRPRWASELSVFQCSVIRSPLRWQVPSR